MGSGRNSNSSKFLWLSLLPARMMKIHKNGSTKVLTIFLPLEVYGDFFRRSRAAHSVDPGQILPNFEPTQAFIAVLVTFENEEDPMKNGRARVLTRFSPL